VKEKLKTPWAFNEIGDLVHATKAVKDDSYICPAEDCKNRSLILKCVNSDYKTVHFSHLSESTCSGESIQHASAKRAISRAIKDDPTASKFRARRTCRLCEELFWAQVNTYGCDLIAAEEERVEPFVCDVVLLSGTSPLLAVEIRYTHAVDDRKADNLLLPWVELDAESVLENVFDWKPLRCSQLGPVSCQECSKFTEEQLLEMARVKRERIDVRHRIEREEYERSSRITFVGRSLEFTKKRFEKAAVAYSTIRPNSWTKPLTKPERAIQAEFEQAKEELRKLQAEMSVLLSR
jgi:hypothetical protein